jgi:hypothetical protein
MIRPLRRAHRRLMILLLVALPIVLLLALTLRPAAPVQRHWLFEVRP